MAASGNHGSKEELVAELKRLGIETETIQHPEVFTMEAMMPYMKDISGAVGKNLFMKDKKKRLWLLSARHDRAVNLAKLAKTVGARGLRLAEESILQEKLGVSQGCVTPLALLNDKSGDVTFLLDSDFTEGGHQRVFFHPMTNSETMGMAPEDFVTFLKETGHEPIMVNFDAME
ncbi:putative prolyl-tRNA synthetase associated domain-containing protein 1 [Patiria miniata]|uniref:PrdX deacylase domain-containing protein 1 n=1 Tax=Patiria miniata TaxID=46514 RepID=A0A914B8U1_PATMI|nr:putative prolyl-tRNA synthetase associated domain-containing protein 1 [Patiria miniata]XP_038072248.1 putative prolyl-tRNA synthetase associated domain-containing protein 1 [Patiria miniata]XP_038072249.1 putative prolyl-tRNA synthetase associated domain-containing protein 1 [Patiria miniata]XP_038072250.1 putative prolyl-tRNA synthetase associated domain-containing protein 1 [Patiria miniata]